VADVIPFRRPSLKERYKGRTLCRHGHHKWVVDNNKQFDVKQGRLVTVSRCSRCGKEKVESR